MCLKAQQLYTCDLPNLGQSRHMAVCPLSLVPHARDWRSLSACTVHTFHISVQSIHIACQCNSYLPGCSILQVVCVPFVQELSRRLPRPPPGQSPGGSLCVFSNARTTSASLLKAVLCGVHGTVFSRLLTWATAGNCVGGAGGTDCSGMKANKYPSSKPAHTPSCSQMCFSTQTLPMDVSMPYQSMHVSPGTPSPADLAEELPKQQLKLKGHWRTSVEFTSVGDWFS